MEEKKTLELQEEKTLTKPISEEEFKKKAHEMALANYKRVEDDFMNGILHLRDYSGVKKFKSIRRAIRRGHVSIYGQIYPHRPFKNTKNNKYKRIIYGQLKHKATIE